MINAHNMIILIIGTVIFMVVVYELWFMDHGLGIMDYGLWIKNYGLWMTVWSIIHYPSDKQYEIPIWLKLYFIF